MINLYTKKKRFVAKFVRKAPVDCTDFGKNNISNYDTITSIPEEFDEMDFSETKILTRIWSYMRKLTEYPSIYAPNATECVGLFSNTTLELGTPVVELKYVPDMNIPKATNLNSMFHLIKVKNFEGNRIKPSKTDFINLYNFCNNSNGIENILSMFDTSNCTNLAHAFSAAHISGDICYMNTENCQSFENTFNENDFTGIEWEINLQCATNINSMFGGCTNLLDGGIKLINVPRTLDLSKIGCASSKYTVKNYIDKPLEPTIKEIP